MNQRLMSGKSLLKVLTITAAMIVIAGCDQPVGPTDDDTTAPANATDLTATAGDGSVTLSWSPPGDADFDGVEISFTPAADGVTQPITVASGTNSRQITGLANGTQYTFTVQSVDTGGNRSTGATTSATPNAFTVTYSGNGNTGGNVPEDSIAYVEGQTVTVLPNENDLTRTDYAFSGWNTEADGSGTSYTSGDSFAIGSADVVLYAMWYPAKMSFGGTDYSLDKLYILDSGTFTLIMASENLSWDDTSGLVGTGHYVNFVLKLSTSAVVSGTYPESIGGLGTEIVSEGEMATNYSYDAQTDIENGDFYAPVVGGGGSITVAVTGNRYRVTGTFAFTTGQGDDPTAPVTSVTVDFEGELTALVQEPA